MRALLLHNSEAGDGEHSRKRLMALLRHAGLSATYCSTKGPDFPEALEQDADLFVVAGGDGTVGKVLRKMPDRRVPVAILPLGTANNIARSLGVAGEPKSIVSALRNARKQHFDIGLACGPWGRRLFVEAVGLGCLTEAMTRIDAVNIERADGTRLGRDTFRKLLSEAKPRRLSICIDGKTDDDDLLLVEVLNIHYAGPGLELAPRTVHGDGMLDIVTVHADHRKDMLAWLGASRPNTPAPVKLQHGRKVTLCWDGSPLRLDDKFPTASNHADRITVELERESATILVPEPEPGGTGKARGKRLEAA